MKREKMSETEEKKLVELLALKKELMSSMLESLRRAIDLLEQPEGAPINVTSRNDMVTGTQEPKDRTAGGQTAGKRQSVRSVFQRGKRDFECGPGGIAGT